MKTSQLTAIGVLALSVALPALAGPDWHVIEQGRKAKMAQQSRQSGTPVAKTQCLPATLALPLDHGPRAQSTAYLNRVREQEQLRTCA